MHWPGHVGAALLLYVPAGVVVTALGSPTLAAGGAAVAVAVSSLPDVDEPLPIEHRGHTHTVWFLLAVTVVAGAVGALLGALLGDATATAASVGPAALAVTAGGATALSLLSHLLADSLTPMGIRPFAPVWNRHWSFGVTRSVNRRANLLLLVAGLLAASLWGAVQVA